MPIPPRKDIAHNWRYPFVGPPGRSTLWAHCQYCGMGQCLALGLSADHMTLAKALINLQKLGFKIVPKLKCKVCQKYDL